MINLLLLVIFVTCLGVTAAWVAENPGQVTMYWLDWRIDTNFAFLLLLLIALSFTTAFFIIVIRKIILAPGQISTARKLKLHRRGLTELTYGVAALASADIRHAERHTKKAERLLGQTPLTLLLSAQIARSQGDEVKTRALLTAMLDHKETEYMAARSLSDVASKQQMFPAALAMAERAHEINPKDTSASVAMIGLYLRLGQWPEAMNAAARNRLRHADRQHYKGIVHLKQGMSLFAGGNKLAALAHARSAIRLLPHFVPAILFAATAMNANGQKDKAVKLLLSAWKKSPHPEIAILLQNIVANESKEKQLKTMRSIVAAAPKDVESALAFARTAILHKEWELARKSLKAALAKEESARACKLMADLEQGEFSDFDAAGRWMTKAAAAAPDSAWTCRACGHVADTWDAHCPSCGTFDSLEWK